MILRPKNRAQSLRVSFGQLLRAISQEVLRIQTELTTQEARYGAIHLYINAYT